MKNLISACLTLAFGITVGAVVSPLFAQQQIERPCSVGEGSNAACSGNWIYFAGNTSAIDNGAWVVRINSETGQVWVRDGNDMELVREPE